MPDRLPYAAWVERDVVEAEGPEAGTYLQGQLTQEIESLEVGGSTLSWVLSPQGKVDALARVCRLSEQRWTLDTDGGWGGALADRLNRFKLRTKVTFSPLPWRVLALRSRGAIEATLGDAAPGETAAIAAVGWPGWSGVDLIGPEPEPPPGWRLAGAEEYEADRIAAGVPVMGRDMDEKTIPAETGLIPLTVSFTKGCYTGQELVARIDSRGGNVPRHLRLMRPAAAVEPGTVLLDSGGAEAGMVTSVAEVPGGGQVALGYTKRAVEMPATLHSREGAVTVAVEAIPR